jgi:outer membrane protein
MRTRYLFVVGFGFALSAAAASPPSRTITLTEAFQASLKRSEVIADQSELIEQAEERHSQAIGSVLPTVNFNASYTVQDAPERATSLSPTTQPLVRLTGTQPLFRGFREFAALRQTGVLTEAQREQRKAAEIQLFSDVASAFYGLAAAEQDLENLTTELGLYDKRIAELRGRQRIGRSRISEVLTFESTESSLKADIAQAEGQLASSRETLAFLTGLPPETRVAADIKRMPSADPLPSYLGRLESRPDLRAARLRSESADEAIAIAKGAHLPSVDASGNYYFKRSGVNEGSRWDAQLGLTFPIFAGGVIQSQVRVAASQARQSELALERARRAAEQEIRTLHQSFEASLTQVQALERSADVAGRSWNEQQREYRLGLVTNIDVLQALTSYEISLRSLDRARAQAKLSYARLEAAVGQLPSVSSPR